MRSGPYRWRKEYSKADACLPIELAADTYEMRLLNLTHAKITKNQFPSRLGNDFYFAFTCKWVNHF